MLLYIVFLFVILTPSILFNFPTKASPLVRAVVHGILFAAIYHFTYKSVYSANEGFATRCVRDSDCTSGTDFCYSNNNQCTPYKSLTKGQFCDKTDICINGCDMDNKVCF
jgi:hypothetical protein